MILKRDYLTPEETLQIGEETIDAILDKTCFDYKVGDRFFFKDQLSEIYTIEGFDVEGDYCLYDNGKIALDDKIFPIFNTGNLIELLASFHAFNLNTFGNGWILLWSSEIAIESKKEEQLHVFLWRALAEIIQSGKYVW
ncbi:hypothetical protein M5X00_13890 [Paenibacillus alvei]|uniref:hypothetical protein n=1 Tax=Paenibacillus alvei TaxID=44250 RepID=UPI00227E7C56|nr:hypothetical protein [Paenibacillus alvei]MCY9755334.1 hypothetical protein [Paenibacillus alvei]